MEVVDSAEQSVIHYYFESDVVTAYLDGEVVRTFTVASFLRYSEQVEFFANWLRIADKAHAEACATEKLLPPASNRGVKPNGPVVGGGK